VRGEPIGVTNSDNGSRGRYVWRHVALFIYNANDIHLSHTQRAEVIACQRSRTIT